MSYLQQVSAWADRILKSVGVIKFAGSATSASAPSAGGGGDGGDGKTPPDGFSPIPGSKHNGYHKRVGNKWVSWYPGKGTGKHAKEDLSQEEHQKAFDSVGPRHRKLLDGMRNNSVRKFEPDGKKNAVQKEGKAEAKVEVVGAEKKASAAKAEKKAPADEAKAEKKAKKPAKAHPHQATMDAVAEHGPDRPIPPTATNVKMHYDPKLNPEAAHTGALMSWVNAKGVTEKSYSAEFQRRTAHAKWTRLATMVPKIEQGTKSLRAAMTTGTKRKRDAAVALALIEETGIRPGSREAAARGGTADTFGATTLKPEHVTFVGDTAHLTFIGKASKKNHRVVDDPELVAALKERVANPTADGFLFAATDVDTRAAMKEHYGKFKVKDLRTLQGSMRAADLLAKEPPIAITANKTKDLKAIQDVINRVSKGVSEYLDNTPPMARESYIHPSLFVEWMTQSGIGPEYVKALFKGKKGKGHHPMRKMTPGGEALLNASLKRAQPAGGAKVAEADGDTDDEHEKETYPLSFKGF